MKFKIILFTFLMFAWTSSCNVQEKEDHYIRHFNENKEFFNEIALYLTKNYTEIGFPNDNRYISFDNHTISDPKFNSPLNKKLLEYFSKKRFLTVFCHQSGAIEFLVGNESNNFFMTETKMIFLYSPTLELPVPYQHWSKQTKLDINWWYLEFTDAQY